MKTFFKWIAILIGAILLLIAGAAGYGIFKANAMLAETIEVTPETVTLPTDSASLARGEYLAANCRYCHGQDLGGKFWFGASEDEAPLATMWTANLTGAPGSKTENYSDADWVRTLRHGVNPSGRLLFVMPAPDIHKLSERDFTNLVAYLKQVPPVVNKIPETEWRPLGKILMGLGMFGEVFLAKTIDHQAGFPPEIPQDSTKEWGEYFIGYLGCATCHGTDYAGGKSGVPGAPPVPLLNPAGNLGNWTGQQFITAVRTGITPEGKILNVKYMPIEAYNGLTDQDLLAVYKFLKSLPGKPQNTGNVVLTAE